MELRLMQFCIIIISINARVQLHRKGGQSQTSLRKSWLGGTDTVSTPLPRQRFQPRIVGLEFQGSTTEMIVIPEDNNIVLTVAW